MLPVGGLSEEDLLLGDTMLLDDIILLEEV